jgi:PAS domain S-box-containing protein
MLKSFLENNKDYIIKKWISLIKGKIGNNYKHRPEKELFQTVSLAFEGNYEVLCNNNWEAVEEFIVFITKLRLEKGFALSEVQRAFGIFRIIMIEMLPDCFSGKELKNYLEKVNYTVDVTINRFSDYFQKKHEEAMSNMLQILEKRVAERTNELKNSEKRYKTLVEDINDGYFVAREDKIIFANNALCRMFGYSKHEMVNMSIAELLKKEETIDEIETKGNIETLGVKKNREVFPIEIKANKIFYENRTSIAGICRDITQRKKDIQKERLADIGRISAAFAHEIRNSLSSIKVNIQVLKNKLILDSIDKKRMEIIFNDIEILDKIIKDTLFFSKPIELNIMRNNINNLIKNIAGKVMPLLNHAKIKLKILYDKKLEACPVTIDNEKMEQVFLNLLYNSMEALKSKKGEKHIKISSKLYTKNKHVNISVFDNGVGISKEVLPNIFKPFYTTNSKGMGLGLANVERIVSLHGGKVEVKTEVNKFTEFHIILPC